MEATTIMAAAAAAEVEWPRNMEGETGGRTIDVGRRRGRACGCIEPR